MPIVPDKNFRSKFHLEGGHTAHFSAKFPILPVQRREAPNVQCCIMDVIVKIVTRTVVCTHLMVFLKFY
jgi:hypothetical protein